MNTKPNVCEKTKFQCTTCGKYFTRKYNLKIHFRTHTGEKPYRCDDCGKEFVTNTELKVHTRSHTGETPYDCDECGKEFVTSGDLKKHIRTHTGEKPYECKECEKAFARMHHLNTHIRAIHTREKNYRCDDCGKEFVTNGDLKRHTRSHTGEKPYDCKECGKEFVTNGDLKKHIRTHTGEKPYDCLECGKAFSRMDNLNTHIRRIHSGVKPYQCDVCEKTFAGKGNLSTHIQKVHIKTKKSTQQQQIKCNLIDTSTNILSSTNNIQNKGDSNDSHNPSSVNTFDTNAFTNSNYELNPSPSNYQAIVPNESQKDKNVLQHYNHDVRFPNPFLLLSEEQSYDAQTHNTFNDNMMTSQSISSHLADQSESESLQIILELFGAASQMRYGSTESFEW